MNTQERIDLLKKLHDYLLKNKGEFQIVKQEAAQKNLWFIPEFIELAVNNIASQYLEKNKLEAWLKIYECGKYDNKKIKKSVGIVMAGNIPLVGFHDFLCVFASGHKAVIKPSSKDDVLIKHLFQKLFEWNTEVKDDITFAENLKGCDAYIATGSNNSSRYFEYYFGKYPNIIRRNRTSVAVLNGSETEAELSSLADDIQQYFGLGCRSVTKLYVPEEYNFIPLLSALKKYNYFIDFHKYKNNYDYRLTLLILNNIFYMTNDSVILTESSSPFSPVSQVQYEFYSDKKKIEEIVNNNPDIQCIIGHNFIPFGDAQSPLLTDYADGVDTMKFLCSL